MSANTRPLYKLIVIGSIKEFNTSQKHTSFQIEWEGKYQRWLKSAMHREIVQNKGKQQKGEK